MVYGVRLYLGAEYLSQKNANLLNYGRIYKPQKVKGYVLSP